MRLRHKPLARAELDAWDCFASAPEEHKGHWSHYFADITKPLRLELGCGKGRFLADKALQEPDYNYLGVDIKNEMLLVAKHTIVQQYAMHNTPTSNIALASLNINAINTIVAPEDGIARIYINFCNPWYKTAHVTRRLTHPRMLIKYRQFLAQGGQIYFKTDDANLFLDSLRYFAHCGFTLPWQTQNLHQNEPLWNVRTEHELMFSQQGVPIKACIATMQPAVLDLESIAKLKYI